MGAKYSRRIFLRLSGSLAGMLALSACTTNTPSTPSLKKGAPSTATAQLVYQDWRTDYFSALAQEMLEEFHALHPNIQVFYTPDPPDLAEKMMDDFHAHSAPDVLAGCCEFFPVWAQKGFLMDLRPYVEAELSSDDRRDWDEAQYHALRLQEGTQFGLPKYHGALALYFNKDLFRGHGVPFPEKSWTHADYQSAMAAFSRDRSAPSSETVWGSMFDVSWDRIQVHVNGWGGRFVDPADPTKSRMGEPEALAAMQWLHDRIWEDHAMASRLDVRNLSVTEAFYRGRLAMVEDGSWSLKTILENADFDIGVTSFPAGPARRVTMATTDGFGIFKYTRYPEAAWELLKFLISHQYGRAMARAHLLQPARASLVDEWVATVREQYPIKAAEMDLFAFAEGHTKGYSVTPEIFENQEVARNLATAAWEQMFTLGHATASVMREVSAQIDQAHERGSEERVDA